MSRVLPAFSQFFDDAGDPLENGWLRFLISDTNNSDKNTFNDADQTILNANPLQLDAAGRCPDVFGQGIYRIVLYEHNPVTGLPGTQLQVFDPVTAEDVLPGAEGYFAEWISTVVYNVGYIVFYDDNFYESVTSANVGNVPDINPDHWQQIEFLRFWNQYVTYAEDDIAIYDSQLYFSKVNGNLNNTPDVSPAEWEPTASGTILLNWEESGTTFQPLFTGYNLGAPSNMIGNVYLQDSGIIYLGDSQDASIYHNGTSFFLWSAGQVTIGTSGASAINLATSGATKWSLTAAGVLVPAAEYDIGSTLLHIGNLYQGDSKSHFFGTDQDASINHDGTDFWILNGTGVLNIGNSSASAINLIVDSSTRWSINATGDIIPASPYSIGEALSPIASLYQVDGAVHSLGTDQDANLVFDGSDFYITTTSGNMIIEPSVDLILNGWTVTSAGVLFPGIANSFDIGTTAYEVRHIYVGDSGLIYLGSDQDGYVRHDGSDFYISTGTGTFILGTSGANNIRFFSTAVERWVIEAAGNFVPFADNSYDIGDSTHKVAYAFLGNAPTLGAHAANKTYVDPTWTPTNYSLDVGETKLIDQHLSGIDTAVGNIGAGSRTISKHTATAGQTAFTHSKTVATELVFFNGVLLWSTTDYTFSGTVVTLTTAANAGDEVTIITIDDFPITDAVDKTGDTMTGLLVLSGDPTADLGAATKQYVDAVPRDNLLINPEFSINQRGAVSGANLPNFKDYFLDRWYAANANSAPSWSSGVLTIPAGDAVGQIVESAQAGTYTLSWEGTAEALGGETSPYTFVHAGGNITVYWEAGTLEQPMLVAGSYAAPFYRRKAAEELALCMRYYIVMASDQPIRLSTGKTEVGQTYYDGTVYPVRMRTSATVVITGSSEAGAGFNGQDETDVVVNYATDEGFRWAIEATTASTGASSFGVSFTADAEL